MVKASDWLHRRFDNPMLPPKKAALGQQGKAVGCVPPTALLSSGELHHCSSTGSETRNREEDWGRGFLYAVRGTHGRSKD